MKIIIIMIFILCLLGTFIFTYNLINKDLYRSLMFNVGDKGETAENNHIASIYNGSKKKQITLELSEKYQDSTPMEKLRENGYLVLPNLNKFKFENEMNEFYQDDKVNYQLLKKFIDDSYFPTVKNNFPFIKDYKYRKFRFSNNNNSSDASTFHSDIYNYTDENIVPVYTCLYYFDDATLQVIPNSHTKEYLKSTKSSESFKNRKNIDIKAGTFVIIHATIHHRGYNFTKTGNRRVLQMFDVFFNPEDYKRYSQMISTVKTNKSYLMKNLTKLSKNMYAGKNNAKLSSNHYFLMYNDLHYKLLLLDLPPYKKKGKLITYEAGPRIMLENSESYTGTNINIICDKSSNSVDPNRFYLLMLILFIIVIVVLCLFLTHILTKKNNKK